MRKVKTRFISIHKRPTLLHVATKHLTQCFMHQVRRRVITNSARTLLCINRRQHGHSHIQLTALHVTVVSKYARLNFLSIQHIEAGSPCR